MLDISKLTQKDIGKWVRYLYFDGTTELGKIKSYNSKHVFVVYKCANEWDRFKAYTGVATSPGDLVFAEEYDKVMLPTKSKVLYEGKDYDASVKEVNR